MNPKCCKQMSKENNLQRFIDAQKNDFDTALREIKQGRKQSHWMWYIFPQIKGLGLSSTAQFYGIHSLEEAEAYLQHPVLGTRLLSISNELLKLESSNATQIFGSPDDLKLRSSMTLFATVSGADLVFELVLDKFFNGEKDSRTMDLLYSKGDF